MSFEQIEVRRDGPVSLITLNRPDHLNAWTWTMSGEIGEAMAEADADDDVRAIVVTGAGRAFCAGADLSGGGGTFAGGRGTAIGQRDRSSTRRTRAPHTLATPVIAAINGAAVGAGLTITMEWDLRVAAADAKLGFVFNRRGIMPDADLLWLIPRMIGYGRAMDVLMTGRIFTGAEALELGLVNRAVPRDQVLPTALELAHDIAANTAPVSVAITKQLLYEFLSEDDRAAATRRQSALFAWTGRQPDAAEGVTAFLEKRAPVWKLSKTKDRPEDLLGG